MSLSKIILFMATSFYAGVAFTAPAWMLQWQTSDGKTGESPARITTSLAEDKQILFLAWESQFGKLANAQQELPSGDWLELQLKVIKDKQYIFLDTASSTLRLTLESTSQISVKYEIKPQKARLEIAPSCMKANLRQRPIDNPATVFPGIVTCRSENGRLEEITFSTLEGADWSGSNVFETGGKGERWKSFLYKDIATLNSWDFSWGDTQAPMKALVQIPKLIVKAPPAPAAAAFTFSAGLQYLTGTAERGSISEKLDGLIVPLQATYRHQGNAWWSLGLRYDLYAYALEQKEETASVSLAMGWINAEKKIGTDWKARLGLAFASRNILAPETDTSSTLEAPRVQVGTVFTGKDFSSGFDAYFATVSAQGTYTEMGAELFLQRKFFNWREARIEFSYIQMESAARGLDFTSQWMTLGYSLLF